MECLYPFIKDGLWLPCGRCLPCRIRKKREWVARLLCELNTFHGEALFLTLTYRDDKLPLSSTGKPTLRKSDLQKYFKRVRKRLKGRKIKYFACGEYGDSRNAMKRNPEWNSLLGRPHYHVIMFGVGVVDVPVLKDCWSLDDCADWRWDVRNKSAVGFVERDSLGYVAGYVQKKKDCKNSQMLSEKEGVSPLFQLSSQGLGYDYIDAHLDDILQRGYISDGVHKVGLPQTIKRHIGVDCKGRRLSTKSDVMVSYFEKIEERIDVYTAEEWQKNSQKRRFAFESGIRGSSFCSYMKNVAAADLDVKLSFSLACARKGISISEDLL